MAQQTRALEIRWFMTAKVPDVVVDWYQSSLEGKGSRKSRSDLYLLVEGRDDLGLKLRGGSRKLELKWMLGRRKIFCLKRPEAVGYKETWKKMKWNYKKGQDELIMKAFGNSKLTGQRLLVSKDRRRKKYKALPSGVLKPSRGRPERACIVELTSLQAGGAAAWTLGFDFAAPSLEEAEALVPICMERLLATFPAAPLPKERSFGYPAWCRTR